MPDMNEAITESPRRGDGPPPTVIDSPERIAESYADFLTDESGFGPASADRLIFPHDEEQIAQALAEARSSGTCVTVSAGRTGIVGGAVPSCGTLLSLADMNRILGLRRLPDGRFALRAAPGISIEELADRLERRDLGLDPSELPEDEARALEEFHDGPALFYPPDPTEKTAHLGATVATNASGARSFRYGATREHVHGLRVCLASGDVLALERGDVTADGREFAIRRLDGSVSRVIVPGYTMPGIKSAAGYFAKEEMDLVDLFVGSEGTLGVVTEVEVVLSPRPDGILSALAFFPSDEDAVSFVRRARGDFADRPVPGAMAPLAFEFFDSRSFDFLRARKAALGASSGIPELPEKAGAGVLFEQEYDEDSLLDIYEAWEGLLAANGSSMDDTWGGMDEADLERLMALRHGIAEQVNNVVARAKASHPEIHKIGTDTAVPPEALEEMLRFFRTALDGSGLEYVIFGHIGDSHLHVNVLPSDPDELRRGRELALSFAKHVVGLGGTVSAEHGIGRLKHEFLRLLYGDEGLAEMAAVKRALDPDAVLNRGVVFPEDLLAR